MNADASSPGQAPSPVDDSLESPSDPSDLPVDDPSARLLTEAFQAIDRAERASDRAEREWLTALLDSMTEEVYFTDRNQRYIYVNPAAAREFGHRDIEGVPVTKIIGDLEILRPDGTPRPASEAPPLRALTGEVVRNEEQLVRIPRTNELRHRQVSAAPVRDRDGVIIGSVSVVRDITEQKRTEAMLRARDARSSALLELGDRFRALTAPGDLAYAAAKILGETLDVSRCGYGTIDVVAETIAIERDWNAPGIDSIAGLLHFRNYGTYIDDLKRGETVVCPDTRADPRTSSTADRLDDLNVRSFVNMPVTETQGVVALLYLNHCVPRLWTEEELSFIREVAQRTRIAVERRRSEQALTRSEQQLRNEAKRKDEFLAMLAHELRNPLASISAAAHLLTKAEQKPDVATIARDALQRQVRHMARLLDDLLDMARVTHGRVELQLADVDLSEIIVAALETVRPQIDLKGHRCRLEGVADPVYVRGDAVRLTQIMTNLLDNAAKYTPGGGSIEIQVRKEPEHVLVSIADTGIGISSTLMPRIFDLFSRAHESTGSGSGLGIGLSLVKALVDLHGGTIEARSAGEMMGSEFLIRLPLSKPVEAAVLPSSDSTQRIDPLRILIADDNADSATAWSLLLEEQGHTVRTVFDGRSAVLEASRFLPDVALLDIGMPYMSGHEVAQAIRASNWGKQIVLVAVTGWGQAQDRERTRAVGFDHHLTKPATPQELELVLRSVRQPPASVL